MKLNEFLQEIALGDLSGSSLVELSGFQIVQAQLPKVIHALNQALDFFYSTIPLKQSQVILEIKDGVSRYYLDSDYAMSNEYSPNPKYIMDSTYEPYTDDVLSIHQVIANNGVSLAINDPYSVDGVFTPEFNCIQITDGTRKYSHLTVLYRAKHQRIPLDATLDSKLTINIPASFNGALQAYVASIVFNAMGGGEYTQLGNFYYGKFKMLMEELKSQGIGETSLLGTNIKPMLKGWI